MGDTAKSLGIHDAIQLQQGGSNIELVVMWPHSPIGAFPCPLPYLITFGQSNGLHSFTHTHLISDQNSSLVLQAPPHSFPLEGKERGQEARWEASLHDRSGLLR